MGRRWVVRAALGVGLVAAALVAAACGSSSTVGTAGGTATTTTTVAGPLVAQLYRSCSRRAGFVVDRSPTGGAPSPADALSMFLASAPQAKTLRGLQFDPAAPPPSDQPVQSVLAEPTSSGLTTSTTATPAPQWYAHRDVQGRVTVILEVSWTAGWAVDQVEECTPGPEIDPQGVTATTGTAPVPDTLALPPANMTTFAMPASTTSSITTTTTMGGP